jgi:hypothetical protein
MGDTGAKTSSPPTKRLLRHTWMHGSRITDLASLDTATNAQMPSNSSRPSRPSREQRQFRSGGVVFGTSRKLAGETRGRRTLAAIRSRRITGTTMLTLRTCASPTSFVPSAAPVIVGSSSRRDQEGKASFAVSFAIICLSFSTALAKSLFVSPSSRPNIGMTVKTAFKLTHGVL